MGGPWGNELLASRLDFVQLQVPLAPEFWQNSYNTEIFVSLVPPVTLQNETSIQSFHLGDEELRAIKVKYPSKSRVSNPILLTPSPMLYMINASWIEQ